MTERKENLERLDEIKDEMLELVNEALDLVRATDDNEEDHAKRTWYASIVCALTDDHEWCDRSHTLEDTVVSLEMDEEEEV